MTRRGCCRGPARVSAATTPSRSGCSSPSRSASCSASCSAPSCCPPCSTSAGTSSRQHSRYLPVNPKKQLLPSDFLSDELTVELNGQSSIGERGVRFLSRNSDYPYSDQQGPGSTHWPCNSGKCMGQAERKKPRAGQKRADLRSGTGGGGVSGSDREDQREINP